MQMVNVITLGVAVMQCLQAALHCRSRPRQTLESKVEFWKLHFCVVCKVLACAALQSIAASKMTQILSDEAAVSTLRSCPEQT